MLKESGSGEKKSTHLPWYNTVCPHGGAMWLDPGDSCFMTLIIVKQLMVHSTNQNSYMQFCLVIPHCAQGRLIPASGSPTLAVH